MGEVIHHQYAVNVTLDLLPTLDPGERGQTVAQLVSIDSQLSTQRVDREGVLHVMLTDQTELDDAIRSTSVKGLEKASSSRALRCYSPSSLLKLRGRSK